MHDWSLGGKRLGTQVTVQRERRAEEQAGHVRKVRGCKAFSRRWGNNLGWKDGKKSGRGKKVTREQGNKGTSEQGNKGRRTDIDICTVKKQANI